MRNNRLWGILCIALVVALLPMAALAAESGAYRLEKVLVLSRHNIRAPLAGRDSELGRLTPHAWFPWKVAPGELSMRGGELETLMGQYFGQWLEKEGLFPANHVPAPGEMRFYANSFQRTIATAQYFSSGMLPVANVEIERHLPVNGTDPVFLPGVAGMSMAAKLQALAEVQQMGGMQALGERAARGSALVAKVLDFPKSEYAREKGVAAFRTDDLAIAMENGSYTVTGSLLPAMKASDALVLQYYEEPDGRKAAFGHKLTAEEWKEVASLKELGINALYDLPTVSTAMATPLLKVMAAELALDSRKFTFLCGHDINLATVLPALGVEDYELPGTIEAKTPIGSKLVIEKRRGRDGKAYAALGLVYASTEQLRQRTMLSTAVPPYICWLRLKGLSLTEDGFYSFEDVQQRLASAIAAGESLLQEP